MTPASPALSIVDGLTAHDVVHPHGGDVDPLVAAHLRHFPECAYFTADLQSIAETPPAPGDPWIHHQWLLSFRGAPAGEFVFDTSLTRGIVIRHFLALDQDARAQLPPNWLRHLTDLALATARADLAPLRRPLLASISETNEHHAAGWRALGYRVYDIGYAYPNHGRTWADHGAPEYRHHLVSCRATDEGAALPAGDLLHAAVSTFLLDYYGLPEDDPVVDSALQRARQVTA